MRYLFTLLCYVFAVLYIISNQIVSANWLPLSTPCTQYNATTINSGTIIVPKFEGIFRYCAKQEVLENPYSGATITFNGWSYFITLPGGGLIIQNNPPNQAQFLGKYIINSKVYKYDKTPTDACLPGSAILYFGRPGSPSPLVSYTGTWTNQNLFSRVTCTDGKPVPLIETDLGNMINIGGYTLSGLSVYDDQQKIPGYKILQKIPGYKVLPSSAIDTSGCEKPFYDTNAAYGASGVLLVMKDNVGNINTNYCLYNHPILKDALPPYITVRDPSRTRNLDDIIDPSFESGTMLATDSTEFEVTIEDIMDGSNAVSGIKNYSAAVFQIQDYLGNTTNPEIPICNVPLTTFPKPPEDLSNRYDDTDTKIFSIVCDTDTPSFRKTGVYRIDVQAEDHMGNTKNFQTRMIVYPNPDIHIVDKPILPTPSPVNSDGIAMHRFDALVLDTFDNPVYNYPIENIVYTGSANIFKNEVSRRDNALYIKNTYPVITSGTGMFSVFIASVAPGELPTGFGFNMNKWTSVATFLSHIGAPDYYGFGDGSEIRKFLRPYTGKLTHDPDRLVLGYVHTGSLTVNLGSFAPLKYMVQDFFSSISTNDPNMALNYTSEVSTIQMLFTPEQVGTNILDFSIKTHPFAVYYMSGELIFSYITPIASDIGTTQIASVPKGEINRIYVIGNTHTNGKDDLVSAISNIGVNSTVAIKNIIRKNATLAVRGRSPDIVSSTAPAPKIVNGIKYIKGDYTIGDTEAISRDWQTLIVIDGNVTVDTDMFNTGGKIVAIMAMKSDPNSDKGNLFIRPDVRYISSLIYTDGSIESVDRLGSRFLNMDKDRSIMLSKQLVLNGVLISRNTIGGAVIGSNASGAGGKKYTLPGNIGTDDLLLAARFDLSFLRSFNDGYDNPRFTQSYNLGNNAFTVVIHNPNYLQSPPPGFSTQP